MNPSSDEIASTNLYGMSSSSPPDLPSNWLEALTAIIYSRIGLIQIEGKEAARSGTKMLVSAILASVCAFFAWASILAGMIAWISELLICPWYWVALVAGGLHLIAGAIILRAAKPSGKPAFPITRAEFQKDREWINQLKS
jgi:uncharacterized membrane protein YqjE